MIAGGIDLGGTKIEAQIFDADWSIVDRQRVVTPTTYPDLIAAVAGLISWIDAKCPALPIGIAAAGVINPANGLALTANLPANAKPLPDDIMAAAGRQVVYINDCNAMALSETVFGAAKGFDPVACLILGTGIGGGVVRGGRLFEGATGLGGEFGHFPLAAGPVVAHGLSVIRCGCGKMGCTETLLSGPGLSRIARHITGQNLPATQIVARRASEPDMAKSWDIWCELMANMIMTLSFTVDPACIVLGGGLSGAPGLIADLQATLHRLQWPGFALPVLHLAQGGETSGARGAAYAAFVQGK